MALAIFALILAVDQLTKYAISTVFLPGESLPVVPHIFHITYVLNPGAAFGLLENQRVFFVVITLAAAVAIFLLRDHIRREGPRARLGTGLFLGGALGNLIDRIATGYVIDFVAFNF